MYRMQLIFSFSFCAVPLNETAILLVGGYRSGEGALSSVQLLDTQTGRWENIQDLPSPR